MKSKLENRLSNLDQTKVSLEVGPILLWASEILCLEFPCIGLDAANKSSISIMQASLTSEQEGKDKALKRIEELNVQLEDTIQNLDSRTEEQKRTAAKLKETETALGKEKKAGAALGEKVIDLSKEVEQQSARAFKAEDVSNQLQTGASQW